MTCRYCGQPAERCPHARDLLALCQGWRHTGTGLHLCGTLTDPRLAAPYSAALDICEAVEGPSPEWNREAGAA